ncbi:MULTISPECIES: YbaB/EbfC family nucleoid-associated protein [Thermocrispum]|jgi:hypothetical protein|uniref:YbaB/EbfC family DNA-binding protein n=1 Tax=Thermocrispum agreste TaxID=37925 RepID=A0A2W4JJ89_9PSEU|nr:MULTISPECIES: YbaB/EbfC family nucleoid-associated protein [Thermocrispum]PZM99184.1 MAG: YbaB/EbfC family DNA-binding protein [Thermocrispum agreste]
MTDWKAAEPGGVQDPSKALDEALASFQQEAKKLGELTKLWQEGETTVRAKDHSLEMTFDGRGELTGLTFNSSKYRKLPPAQLASVILETYRAGRAKAMQEASKVMAGSEIPGVDFDGLLTGKVKPDEVIGSLMAPMKEMFDSFGLDLDFPITDGDGKERRRG